MIDNSNLSFPPEHDVKPSIPSDELKKDDLNVDQKEKVKGALESIPVRSSERIVDKDLEDALDEWIGQFTVEVPESNPFHSDKILVFSDKYTGLLPNNGMHEWEFHQTTQWINDLKEKGSTGSFKLEGTDEFKQKIIGAIKELCLGLGSRQFLRQAIQSGVPVTIDFGETSEFRWQALDDPRNMGDVIDFKKLDFHVHINTEKSDKVKLAVKGKETWEPLPLATIVGHELIHYLHAATDWADFKFRSEYPLEADRRIAAFHDAEELETIRGTLPTPWREPKIEENEGDWDVATSAQNTDYGFNENWIRTAGGSWPRLDHTGIPAVDFHKKPADEEEALKLAYASVLEGDEKDVETVFSNDWRSLLGFSAEEVMEECTWVALEQGRLNIYNKMITLGVSPQHNDLRHALKSPDPNLTIDFLRTVHGLDIAGPWSVEFRGHSTRGPNLLSLAVSTKNVSVIRHLIDLGLNPMEKNQMQISLLHFAAEAGADLETMRYLIEEVKLDPAALDYAEENALHHALRGLASSEVLEYLITKCKLDPNQPSNFGGTPLHRAVTHVENLQSVETLIKLGANPKTEEEPLIHSAIPYLLDFRMLEYLIHDCHLDPNEKDKGGNTALRRLSESVVFQALDGSRLKKLQALGFNLTQPISADGRTLLHLAAEKGNPYLIATLANQFHLDLFAKDKKGATPLDFAPADSPNRAKINELMKSKSLWYRIKSSFWSPR